ncbi:class I SAM-dependent RNA methyltransferase [uncultured Roseobacter sp.]|uniref:class I SAM-dependent RNA methyltransferase n=1 Tax=uncultured Roseobacter sp. TaxID=114847 RepID=UPI0026041D0A|nr:class I SAM-dependent RNA methyltransferase [uncultured Roseobacter sp.]
MAEYTISFLGPQGDGVADGPVFVPRSLPGERVSGTLDGSALCDVKVLAPSDRRVSAPCTHFKSCGGCQVQHADDAFVAAWKVEIVERALAGQGLSTAFRSIDTSPALTRRRAGFAARRTKKGAMVGFHGRASGTIVPVPMCQLLTPQVRAGAAVAEALAVVGASRKAELSVMITETETALDVAVSHGKPLDGLLRQQLAAVSTRFDLARLAWDTEVVAMRAPPMLRFDGIAVSPPPGAFLQATAQGETALREAVTEITQGARRIIDLFAGCGTFALPLARHAEVHAVEGDAAMVAALDHGWRQATGLKPLSSEARDLFRRPLLPDELARAEAVVIDPPRAGAVAQVAELARARPPRIAYVSCNPVSFARDAKTLVDAGFTLDWIQVVDQFRWSAHVELAACFTAPHIRDEPRRRQR